MLNLMQLQCRCLARCLGLPLKLYPANDFDTAQKDLQPILHPLWAMDLGATIWYFLQHFRTLLDRDRYGVQLLPIRPYGPDSADHELVLSSVGGYHDYRNHQLFWISSRPL